MKAILYYWNRNWQSIAFDPARGEGRVRWLSRKPKHCSGWAVNHEDHWYAVWLDGDDLIFQSGPNRWRMDDVLQCRNIRHDTKRIFTVEQNDATVLKVMRAALNTARTRRPKGLPSSLSRCASRSIARTHCVLAESG